MTIFEHDGVKFQITGTHSEYVDGVKKWFYDIKNLENGKHKLFVPEEKIKKYLKN